MTSDRLFNNISSGLSTIFQFFVQTQTSFSWIGVVWFILAFYTSGFQWGKFPICYLLLTYSFLFASFFLNAEKNKNDRKLSTEYSR